MEAFFQKYEPGKLDRLERAAELRDISGGFELIGIDKSEPLHLEFRLKERDSETVASGQLDVKDGDPAVVQQMGIRAMGPGGPAAAGKAGPARQRGSE